LKHVGVAFAGLCLTGGVLGCTDGRAPTPVQEERTAIVRGMPSVPSDDAVVSITANSIACSATLIAPDVIVTALHCVSQFDLDRTFSCNADGSLATGSTGGTLGPLVDAASIVVSTGVLKSSSGVHGKAIYGTNSPVVCRDDFAIVVLDGPVPVDVPPVTLRLTRSTKDGEQVRAVGYGLTDATTMGSAGAGGAPEVASRNERDGLKILGVGAPNSVIAGDPGVAPRTVMIGEGPCHGDSGGPLFSVETGAEIGVYSLLSTTSCEGPDVRNVYTQIAPYDDLINMALSSVGEAPIAEVTPGGDGEGGMAGQAGEPSTAGVPGEAGAPPESAGGSGGSGGSGGKSGVGGRGGTGAVAGSSVGGTGGDTSMGDDTSSEAGAQGEGSGSRQDPSCTCRTGRGRQTAPWPLLGLCFGALTFLRRRRRH